MKNWLLVLMVGFSAACFAEASIHYVSLSGTSIPPYTNWVTAATNIQDAVDTAVAGDTILVSSGIYTSGAEILVTRAITLQSINGPETTVVDGQKTHRCFNLGNVACTLSGFTIQNGDAGSDYGGGVKCSGTSPLITNCVLSGNSAGNGGGSYLGTLTHCSLTGNSAGNGGGSSDGTLTHCTLTGNSAADTGGGSSLGTLTHCTLIGNSAGNGGGSSQGTLTHCTLIGNSAGNGGGSYIEMLTNCILWGNTASDSGDNILMPMYITYSCWPEGATWGSGNISSNPCLANGYLTFGSPCIDAGTTNVTDVTEDLSGTPVPLDGDANGSALPDMGAYEFVSMSSDTDGDDLNDWAELNTYHSDPTSSDSDGDGRSDGDEVASTGYSPIFNENIAIADARGEVTNNPSTYGLYTADSISDLSMGNVMIQTSNGWVRLNLQLEQCTNLTEGVWEPASDAVNWQLEAPDGKVFYRVRSGE